MATFSISGIAIKGITCCVPKNRQLNRDLTLMSADEIEKFIEATGVEERRIVDEKTCTSDLCLNAAEKLISDLKWKKEEIDVLVFVSQTADYILPVTSTILQDRLGLSQNCIAFDVPLGCSGYVYGISVVASMMKAAGLKRGILLAGDTISKWVSKTDKSTYPLFGDSGSATAFELDVVSNKIQFDLGTDGSGYKAIIIPHGGSRNKGIAESMDVAEVELGISRNQCQLVLDGMDVFSFGISQAPKSVNKLLDTFAINKGDIDFYVFHQANLMMNKMIAKKLKIPVEKVPHSLRKFGNTSSASIPLTIITELKEQINSANSNLILCGFGVGLSWGAIYLTINSDTKLVFSEYE
jgi:3-oxoacyl-[acyl-carrier-protein] synthase-3